MSQSQIVLEGKHLCPGRKKIQQGPQRKTGREPKGCESACSLDSKLGPPRFSHPGDDKGSH